MIISNADGLAVKLNYLKKESARYNSHKDFLSSSVDEKLILKCLELTLKPNMGNYDQDFIDSWGGILK